MKLNLGAGSDVRPGFLNVDTDLGFLDAGPERVCHSMVALPFVADASCDLILVNHSLHQLTYDDADRALGEWWRVLAPGGRLVIVDADVIRIIYWTDECHCEDAVPVAALISDECEPTFEGKILRWACWFGERRSLWSAEMLCERLRRLGLHASDHDPWADQYAELVGNRAAESFLVVASK